MYTGKYILVDGTFVPTDEYRISLAEAEAVNIVEVFRAIRTSFPFFKETLERLILKLKFYGLSFDEFTEREGAALKRQLERTFTRNKHFMGAKLKLTLRFFNGQASYTIQSDKTATTGFELNEKGLFIEIFDKVRKPISPLSTLTQGSSTFWELANCHLKASKADGLLIVNTDGLIVEYTGANLYLIKKNTVRGISYAQGAYSDISKPIMLKTFERLGLEYTEDKGITRVDLREANELLIVNAIDGIKWILGYKNMRYSNLTIRKINEMFNSIISG